MKFANVKRSADVRPEVKKRGLYVHVPFCVRKCRYCDFYSLPGRLNDREAYVNAVLVESKAYTGKSFRTMYFGGGTPGLLGDKLLAKLIAGLENSFDLSLLEEATIEVNPDSASVEFLKAAIDCGINRVSIGVQSLDDRELQAAGRIHTASQALEAVKGACKLGLKSVSADIIAGLPGQAWPSLRRTIDSLVDSGAGHISLYCLSLEPGTSLAENPPGDLPDEDAQAELFERASFSLLENGFIHYEISNFARQGHECRHNLNYWRGGEYLGLGPAAASHLDGKRYKNSAGLDAYLNCPGAFVEGIEELDARTKVAEEAMLRLRLLTEGIDLNEMAAKFGHDNVESLSERLHFMVNGGKLVAEGSHYRLSPSRVLTANPIFAEVLT